MIELAQTDTAWIAGFFDGEGCICITKTSKGYQFVQVLVSQKDPTVLWWMQEKFRMGNVYKKELCHQLAISKQEDVVEFLSALLPYLRVKKGKAEEAIAKIGVPQHRRKGRVNGTHRLAYDQT